MVREEKTGEEEKQGTSKTMSTDLNDYTIIKEGEAEILMHAKNEVFYNKTQVNNGDMSIAVLRTFIAKQKEYEAMLSKKTKGAPKATNECSLKLEEPTEFAAHNGEPNGECGVLEDTCIDEPCSISEEPVQNVEGKGHVELKPPRVLEALLASGLRALRYAREVEAIGQVVALDNDKG